MKVAEVLSDLTSLRACDPKDALALVSDTSNTSKNNLSDDPKFLLAKEFLELTSQQQDNQELEDKRRAVEEILRTRLGNRMQGTASP